MNKEELGDQPASKEKKRLLEALLVDGYSEIDFDNVFSERVIKRCMPYVKGEDVLCLGYAGDRWPSELMSAGFKVDIVEGAKTHFDRAMKDFAGAAGGIFYETFESFAPPDGAKYDTVIAGNVIEFFLRPQVLLDACVRMLKANGRLIVTTPNALSIHRRLGAILNIESSPFHLNEKAKDSACHQLYVSHSLREVLRESGFRVQVMFGAQLQILSKPQMKSWPLEIIQALDTLASELGIDFCKTLVAICDAP
jgi:2-polyprenyl-3-methyl-5-hydroxy-6-metoxy-1,4-benzoquinol methylase